MAEAGAQDAVICESCTSTVHHMCLTCSSQFCDNCRSLHDKEHHVIPFSEKHAKPSEMCEEHKELIQLYCKTCKDLVCLRCLVGRHNGHTLVEIEETYKTERLDFEERTEEIERRAIYGAESSLEKTKKNLSSWRESVSEIRSTMKRDAAVAKEIIDNALAAQLRKLDSYDSKCSSLLLLQKDIITKHLTDLETDITKRKNISESNDHIGFLKEARRDREQRKKALKSPKGFVIQSPEFSVQLTDQVKQTLRDVCGRLSFSKNIPDENKLIQYVDAPPPKHWKPPAVITTLDVREHLGNGNLTKMCRINKEFLWIADQRHTSHKISGNGELICRLAFAKADDNVNSDIICLKGHMILCVYRLNPDPTISSPERSVSWQTGISEYPCCLCLHGDSFLALLQVGFFVVRFYLKVFYEDGTQKKDRVQLDKKLQCILSEKGSYPNFMVQNSMSETCVISYKTGSVVVGSSLDGNFCFEYRGQKPGLKGQDFKPQGLATDRYGHILIADVSNSCIHMLQSSGNFLTYIATSDHGLDSPVPLSIDSNGLLWIGEYSKRVIIVLDYLL